MPTLTPTTLPRSLQLRRAVLHCFSHEGCAALKEQRITAAEWKRLLTWLHTSGLALYLLDRLMTCGGSGMLPTEVREGLQQNLAQNTGRSQALFDECAEINRVFQAHGFVYANLKGLTLWPLSVPKFELRSQLDLDFMIHPQHVQEAQRLLEQRGYRLHAVSGSTWEFKASEGPPPTLRDLYKPSRYRSLELHVEPEGSLRFDGVEVRRIDGVSMPSLGSVDLYINQGLHLFKHIRSEFTRLSWLVEFRQHTLARAKDAGFQNELARRIACDRRSGTALAMATDVSEHMIDAFAFPALQTIVEEHLTPQMEFWIQRYSLRALLADFPGSKLYLLFAGGLGDGLGIDSSSLRRTLIPLQMPPRIAAPAANDAAGDRIRRYRKQIRFILLRLRFHLVEGLRYAAASLRWRYAVMERSR